jgi:hypothetical protein
VALIDRLPGWDRVHADDIAVVHKRNAGASVKQPGPYAIPLAIYCAPNGMRRKPCSTRRASGAADGSIRK